MFEEYMEDKHIYQVYRYDGVIDRNKDYLFGEPVDYDQDSIKPKG